MSDPTGSLGPLRLRVAAAAELPTIADDWERCRVAVDRPQLPQRLEIFTRWSEGEPTAVLAESGDGLIGVAPVLRHEREVKWTIRMRTERRVVARWRLDTVDLVGEGFAAPAGNHSVHRSLYAALMGAFNQAGAIRFRIVADDTELGALLGRSPLIVGGGWLRLRDPVPEFRYRTDLEADLHTYLAKHMGTKSRHYLARDVRRLDRHEDGTVVECFTAAADMAPFLQQAATIEGQSWHRRRNATSLGGRARTVDRLEAFAEQGLMRAYVLRVGAEPVAFLFGYASDGCLQVAKMAFVESWARRSPGKVLLWHVLDDLHRREEFSSIDLGPGDWDFKRYLARDGYVVRDTTFVRIRPRPIAAMVPPYLWRRGRVLAVQLIDRSAAADKARRWVRRNFAR